MSMVEVDPNLFIKCRLCLEECGTYQIVPLVREQISYCYDINVEPFDGLPQLICKKCQSILCDYSKTKRSYTEKQENLREITQVKDTQQEKTREPVNTVNSSLPIKRSCHSIKVAKYHNKRRKIRESSVSSHESQRIAESKQQLVVENTDTTVETEKLEWTNQYQKTFACSMCTSTWFTRRSAVHHKFKHNTFKLKHADIFRKHWFVELPRIDDKPNLTGSLDNVVYSMFKIITMGNTEYSIAYKYTGQNSNNGSDYESVKRNESCNLDELSDSASKDSETRICRRRKIRRISSRSSTETVLLNESNGKSPENECINIADTDSDDEIKTKVYNKDILNSKISAVNKLITTTHHKYFKKHEKEKPVLDQLNRKITSIGRQIINKRGFNCTRIIKYLEHMNLNIIWLSRTPQNVTSNSNYFKIIPRLRYATEKTIDDFDGLQKNYDKSIRSIENETLVHDTNIVETSNVAGELTAVTAPPDVVKSSQDSNHYPWKNQNSIIPASIHANGMCEINVLPDLNADNILQSAVTADTRKLLNANPVANPKQLPKKINIDTNKDKMKQTLIMPTLEVNTNELSEVTLSGNANIQMPIIKFTTSLAVPQAENPRPSKDTANNTGSTVNAISENPKPAPRIKVKPVTELMSKETLSRMQESTAPVSQKKQSVPQKVYEGLFQNTMPVINNVRSLSPGYNCDDYIILDTVELPNTKTSSPFKYFRMLLQVHNITLLDTDATLSGDFDTLIKFKVLYKQETKDLPVVLCLSLFCVNSTFCLKVRDRNEDNINMAKITANWQWEILKIYRGEVVSKVISNAEKISPEVHENTNRFFCLLKSINCVTK